jgi:NAD(P)-dependent dehydrogenase (short-subunit alcohol dehydrogenase family)
MSTTDLLTDRTILVTGANRGLGKALVDQALERGARRVYAGARQPFTHPASRVTPLLLDVTDAAHVEAAAKAVDDLDVLVNNAGQAAYGDLGDRAVLEQQLAVNLFGPYAVTQAFLPSLIRSRGVVVNVLSLAALASVPVMPAYSVSKAAALSLTQGLRALLGAHGVRVHAVLAGPLDTDMTRDLDIPKALPAAVAQAILDSVNAGEDDIFPDPLSATMAADWPNGAIKMLERQNAALSAD